MQVDVYKNLHKQCYSVKDRSTGRVVAHERVVAIQKAKLVVQPAGRERVLQERKKNVHAFVRGEKIDFDFPGTLPMLWTPLSYNPYRAGHFTIRGSDRAVVGADLVILNPGGMLACGLKLGV